MTTSMKANQSTPRLRSDIVVDSECKGAKGDSDIVLAFKSIQAGFRRCPELSCRFESVVMKIMQPS